MVQNEIRTTDYGKSATPGDAASVAKHYDGFGLESAVIREGYGGDGQDNVSIRVCDALGRVTENWLPFSEATASDLPQLFTKPTKREEAAIATYDDDEAVSLSVYPQEVSKTPLFGDVRGTGYAEHPAKHGETCSSTTVTERKVVKTLEVERFETQSGRHLCRRWNWTVCDAKTVTGVSRWCLPIVWGGRCSAGRFYLTVSLLTPILYAALGRIH